MKVSSLRLLAFLGLFLIVSLQVVSATEAKDTKPAGRCEKDKSEASTVTTTTETSKDAKKGDKKKDGASKDEKKKDGKKDKGKKKNIAPAVEPSMYALSLAVIGGLLAVL